MISPRTHKRHPIVEEDREKFVRKVVTTFGQDVEADFHNIEPARQDMQFVVGDQWDHEVRLRREKLRKPVLTVNRLPAFVAQHIGSWLQNDTTIRLTPLRGGSRAVAEIRQGLIRATTRRPEAKVALHNAMANAYICGVGNFRLAIREAINDVFVNDIVLEPVEDPFGVIWDRASTDPSGADAQHCFVMDYMTREDFDETYPAAKGDAGWVADEHDVASMLMQGYGQGELVRVCQFWQMRTEPVVLGMEAGTGDVIDLTDVPEDERLAMVAPDSRGNPMIRETVRPYAECHVLTQQRVLEGPFRLDIPRLPVFRVQGWVITEGQTRYRWGFVRNAKDPQRLHNYWRSVMAEELQKSVSTKWLLDNAGGKNQYAEQFRRAHRSDDNVLFWDSQAGAAAPQQFPPPPMNASLLTEAQMTVQDIRDVTNKHEAALGIQSNEVSGRAINARQRQAELGDVIYVENMNAAIAEAGRVMNELIPQVYDTARTVKIIGEDDQELLQEINGTAGDATPDITRGKYEIGYSTGPSYATKRQEAVDIMMTLMNTMPQVGNVVADIIVRNMDIPGAEEIEERLASMMPPGMVNPDRLPARRRQEVEQRQAAAQQAQEEQQRLQRAMLGLQIQKLQAEVMELQARAGRQAAQAENEASRVGVDRFEAQIKGVEAEIQAVQLGVEEARLGMDAFYSGLESATQEQQRRDAAQAAQAAPNGAGQETGDG